MTDTNKGINIFQHPSTFTFLSRHVSGINAIINETHSVPKQILDFGCSVFEPFYFEDLLDTQFTNEFLNLTCVDSAPDIINMITHLLNKGTIARRDFIYGHTNNINDSGDIRPNSDMNNMGNNTYNMVGIEMCVKELMDVGLNPKHYIDPTLEFFKRTNPRKNITIKPVQAEILEFLQNHQKKELPKFNMIYGGTVLMNIKKKVDNQGLLSIYNAIHENLSDFGVFGMGTTPFDLYGKRSCINELTKTGFTPLWWAAENLLSINFKNGKKLLGDYAICSVKNKSLRTHHLDIDGIAATMRSDKYLKRINITHQIYSLPELVCYLTTSDSSLTLAATINSAYSGEPTYSVFKASRGDLNNVLPPHRHLFPLLEYNHTTSINTTADKQEPTKPTSEPEKQITTQPQQEGLQIN